jgi:hypothetical protein
VLRHVGLLCYAIWTSVLRHVVLRNGHSSEFLCIAEDIA